MNFPRCLSYTWKSCPSSPPFWEALRAPKQINLAHLVPLNKRELCSFFFLLLLFPSPFPSSSHLTFCLFLEQENPLKTFLALRKQFVVEFYSGSLEQARWPTNVHLEGVLCTEKSSGTEGSGRGRHQYLLAERQFWDIEAHWLACFLCGLKSTVTNL